MGDAVEAVAGAGQEVLTFGSEAERMSALLDLPETPENLGQIERIRSAGIVPKSEDGEGGQPAAEQTETQPQAAIDVVPQAETPVVSPVATGPITPITLSPEELRAAGFTYNNSADVIKGLKEKESFIVKLKEQEALIREQMRGGNDNAQKRIAELEAELARTRTATQAPAATAQQSPQSTGAQPVSVSDAQSTLNGIQAEIAELEKAQAEVDPYDTAGIAELQSRHTKLIRMQTQAVSNVITAQAAIQNGFERQRAAEEAERQRQEKEARETQARIAAFAELDAVGSDAELAEFKLSKPAVEVEKDLRDWQSDIAAAYYGRKPYSWDEIAYALNELQTQNTDLRKKCQLAGIPVEPPKDVTTYLSLLDLLDYRDGWRPDPARPGQAKLETRYDPATGRNIPVVLPDLKTAIKMKRLNEGHYKQQVDSAYQRGANSIAAAMAKRDPAVAELNDPSTMGQSGDAAAKWAVDYLVNVDEEEAMRRLRAGDSSMFDGINKARAICGIEPITFDQ